MVHRNALSPGEFETLDAIPVTSPARTLLDAASVAPRDVVEEALDEALRRRLVSMPRLRWGLEQWERSRRPGVAIMRALMEARDPAASVPQSVFETRLLRTMKQAALPRPVRQHQVRIGGQLVAVLDFAFPDARLGIEADGYRWHSGRIRWEHDRARRNRLTLLGWRIIHVIWSDLTDRPQAVIHSIRSALTAGFPRPPDRRNVGPAPLSGPSEPPSS
jgi:very-short-patch-repair endonuclease